jgi:hypothetical protein
MSIAPFHPAPAPARRSRTRRASEVRRARLALALAAVGIAAALIAYAISPTVRHAVGHAEHSVKHTVTNIFDHDTGKHKHPQKGAAAHHANTQAKPSSGLAKAGVVVVHSHSASHSAAAK